MGTNLREFTVREEVTLPQLRDRGGIHQNTVAIDTYTWIHQFLHKIQSGGEPLRDSEGRITSHISGLYYRTMNLLENNIYPIFVMEGDAPELKSEELEDRRESKEKARKQYRIAQMVGDEERLADLSHPDTLGVDDDMLQSAFELLECIGCPVVVPPSEGEAQCARMCAEGQVDYVISSDYDTLLFGSNNLIQNLNSSGGELIDREKSLQENELTQRELVWLGILMGTDFNTGADRVGPKRGRSIVDECNSIGEVIDRAREYDDSVDEDRWREVYDLFASPSVDLETSENVEWSLPIEEEVKDLLVERHGFSESRVSGAMAGVDTISENQGKLGDF